MNRRATKNQQEREDAEAERLERPSPKLKPPRRDRRRERMDAEPDKDLKSEHNPDPDTSRNYKDIGGSVLERWSASLTKKLIFTYPNGEAMNSPSDKSAVYHGIDPADNDVGSYPEWSQPYPDEMCVTQMGLILAAAKDWLRKPVLAGPIEGYERNTQLRAALDLGLKTSGYDRHITPQLYDKLLAQLAGRPEPGIGETLTKLASPYQPSHEAPSMNSLKTALRQLAAKSAKESAAKTVHNQTVGKFRIGVRKISDPRKDDIYRVSVTDKGLVLFSADKSTKKDAIKAAENWMASSAGKKELDKRAATHRTEIALRQFVTKLAATDPKLAYELNELVDNFEQPMADKSASTDERFSTLRSMCIRTAAADADAKKTLMPILQVIKDLA